MVRIKLIIKKNYKYFSFFISIIIFIVIFGLTYLDVKTYNHSNFNNFWEKIKYMLDWFSCWNLFYCALISFILIFFEIYYLKNLGSNNSKIIYKFLKVSTATYCLFVFMVYNSLCIFNPSMITDDSHSLQSLIEHRLVPLFFNVYLITSIKKDFYKKITIKDIFLKIIPLTFIYPIIYIAYCGFLGFKIKFYPYFIFDINKIGILKFIFFMSLILFFNTVIATLYSIPTILRIYFNDHQKNKNIKKYNKKIMHKK